MNRMQTSPAAPRYRADAIVVLHLNPQTKSCRILSVPRDTRTELPGYGQSKINHALLVGGIIAPGLQTGAETLVRRTAALPSVDLPPPERVIGRRTDTAMRSGIFFGAVESIDGVVRRIKAEWKRDNPQAQEATLRGGLIGSPETIARKLRRFRTSHIDQVILLNQAGKNSHEHICESLELFASEVMPEFRRDPSMPPGRQA